MVVAIRVSPHPPGTGQWSGDWLKQGNFWGVSTSPDANKATFWSYYGTPPYALFWAYNVPEAVAERFYDIGRSEPALGYVRDREAMRLIAPYLDITPFYEDRSFSPPRKHEDDDDTSMNLNVPLFLATGVPLFGNSRGPRRHRP